MSRGLVFVAYTLALETPIVGATTAGIAIVGVSAGIAVLVAIPALIGMVFAAAACAASPPVTGATSQRGAEGVISRRFMLLAAGGTALVALGLTIGRAAEPPGHAGYATRV